MMEKIAKLSILSPLKITNQKQFELFIRCLDSYRNIIKKKYVEFLIVNESSKYFKNKVYERLYEIKPNLRDISEVGFVKSVRRLIDESKGEYIMFFLDDVEMVSDSEEICEVSIESMDLNKDIFQVKIGGGKVSNISKTKSLKMFSKNHKEIKINNNFSVWLNKNKNEYETNNYVITHWNCITRGQSLRRFNKLLKSNPKGWDGLTLSFSSFFKKEIENKYTGWLNLQSFIYPWGRTKHEIKEWIEIAFS